MHSDHREEEKRSRSILWTSSERNYKRKKKNGWALGFLVVALGLLMSISLFLHANSVSKATKVQIISSNLKTSTDKLLEPINLSVQSAMKKKKTKSKATGSSNDDPLIKTTSDNKSENNQPKKSTAISNNDIFISPNSIQRGTVSSFQNAYGSAFQCTRVCHFITIAFGFVVIGLFSLILLVPVDTPWDFQHQKDALLIKFGMDPDANDIKNQKQQVSPRAQYDASEVFTNKRYSTFSHYGSDFRFDPTQAAANVRKQSSTVVKLDFHENISDLVQNFQSKEQSKSIRKKCQQEEDDMYFDDENFEIEAEDPTPTQEEVEQLKMELEDPNLHERKSLAQAREERLSSARLQIARRKTSQRIARLRSRSSRFTSRESSLGDSEVHLVENEKFLDLRVIPERRKSVMPSAPNAPKRGKPSIFGSSPRSNRSSMEHNHFDFMTERSSAVGELSYGSPGRKSSRAGSNTALSQGGPRTSTAFSGASASGGGVVMSTESAIKAIERRTSLANRVEKRKELAQTDISYDKLGDHELESYEYLEFIREMMEGLTVKKICQKSTKIVKRTFHITPDLTRVYWGKTKKSSLQTNKIDKVLKGFSEGSNNVQSKGKSEKDSLYVSVVCTDGKALDLEAKDEVMRRRLFIGFTRLAHENRSSDVDSTTATTATTTATTTTTTNAKIFISTKPLIETVREEKEEEKEEAKKEDTE